MKWLKSIFGCKHKTLLVEKKLEPGMLNEPGIGEREVIMRIATIHCKFCKDVFRLVPMGVAHDPIKGIRKCKDEPDVEIQEIEMTPEIKKELNL